MALPHWLARANLAVINRLVTPFAARLPWFGVLEHAGRRSGTVRRTVLMIYRKNGGEYVIGLPYGTKVEWLANVLAAGTCRVRTRGRWVTLGEPRRFRDPTRRQVPWLVRPALAALNVSEFVELRRRR